MNPSSIEKAEPGARVVATELRAGDAFVGRRRELALLRTVLERARTGGGGGVLLITGEAGIGKTRLARMLAKVAESDGVGVVWGRSWEGGGAPTFWPWIEAMRGDMAAAGAEALGWQLGGGGPHLVHLFPELRGGLPGAAEPSEHSPIDPEHADPEHARFLLFDSLTHLLIAAASRKPLMVVLDDLHAADTPSLLLLEYVARYLDDARLLIVATVRDAELRRRPEAAEILSRFARGSARMVLGGLSEVEVAELVAASTAETVPREVVREIHRVSDGSPLFVQEVVRTLAVEGRLSSPGTRIGGIPEQVRDVIGRRLAPLPAHCHDLLSVAAAVGKEFEVGVLQAVCDRPRTQILEILDEAIREGIVEVEAGPGGAGRFRFAHALFRETLYQGLQHSRRLGLHLQVARALEKAHGGPPEFRLSELAHHFFEAAPLGGADKAIDYTMRAAAAAAEQLAYEEAIVLYERALGLSFTDERVRAEVLARLAQAQRSLGLWEAALPTWEKALVIYERLGDREAVGRICWDVGHQLGTAWRWPESFAFVGRGLAALGDVVNADHVRLLTRSGVALSAIGHHDAGREAIERGLAMAEMLGEEPLIGYATYSKTIHHWCYLDVDDTIEAGQRAAAQLRRSGDLDHACNASTMVLGAQLLACRLQDAKRTAAELRPFAGKLAQHLSTWLMQAVDSAVAAIEGGDLVAAERDLLASIESAPRFEGDTYLVAVLYGILASWRGDTETALRQFEQVSRFDNDTAITDSRSYVVLTLALAGRTDEALTLLAELRHRFARSGQPNTFASWKLLLSAVEVFVLAGKRDAAAELYPTVLEAKTHGARSVGIDLRFVDTVAGMAATAAREWDRAEEHYRSAIRLAEEMPHKIEQPEVRRLWAAMLLERGAPRDREQARSLLDDAIGMYRKLGMPRHQRIAEALRASVGLAPAEEAAGGRGVEAILREEGDYWTVGYSGRTFHLRGVKGLRYLRELLRNPGQELPVAALTAEPHDGSARRTIDGAGLGLRSGASALGDAGEILDARAKTEYAARLRDLRGELDEATRFNDSGRSARLEQEIDALTRELASAVGLGGRDRRAASAAERARVNVTRTVTDAVKKIAAKSPELGEYLSKTIKTGASCSYDPDPEMPVTWRF